MTKKSKPFATLMVEILHHRDLSPTDKVVYMHIRNQYLYFSSQKKPYIESVQTIADAVGVSEKSVRNSVSSLIECGYLAKQQRGHNMSCMYIPQDYNIRQDVDKKKQSVSVNSGVKKVRNPLYMDKDKIPF